MSGDKRFSTIATSSPRDSLHCSEVIYIRDDPSSEVVDQQDARERNDRPGFVGGFITKSGLFPNSPYSTVMTMRLSIIKWQETPGTALVWVAREYPELSDCECIELAEALQCLNPNDEHIVKVIELLQNLTPQHIHLVVGYIHTMITGNSYSGNNRQHYHLRKMKSSQDTNNNRHSSSASNGGKYHDYKGFPKHNRSRNSSQQHASVHVKSSVNPRVSVHRSLTPQGSRSDNYRRSHVATTTTTSTTPPIINVTRPSIENESLFDSRFIYKQL